MVRTIDDRMNVMKIIQTNGDFRKVWPSVDRASFADLNVSRLYQVNQGKSISKVRSEQQRNNINTRHDPESFHCAVGKLLIVAQLFGILPVYGVLEPSPRALVFRKLSIRTGYAIFVGIMLSVVTTGSVIHLFKSLNAQAFQARGGFASATVGTAFYGNSFIGLLMFLWLSPRWASLQTEWRAVERLIDSLRWGRPKLRRKFSVITAIVFISALVEHVLSVLNNAPSYRAQSTNASLIHFLEEYSLNSHSFITGIWGYNPAWGVFLFVIGKIATFMWNFTDVFIMLISTGLAERYKMLNQQIASKKVRRTTEEWKMVRECYAALSALVKRVDEDVSQIVLLSFANNLYFICLQLLNGISGSREPELINRLYFFGSFGFLVGRTIGVTLLAARINDQSQVALPVLYTCSSTTYCIETQRLEHQLVTDTIALSGFRFFSITRNFMLAVAGAIVTYEVVLLQFNLTKTSDSD